MPVSCSGREGRTYGAPPDNFIYMETIISKCPKTPEKYFYETVSAALKINLLGYIRCGNIESQYKITKGTCHD